MSTPRRTQASGGARETVPAAEAQGRPNSGRSRLFRRPAILGLLVATAALALLVVTEPKLSIVWDEGYTLGREARVRAWFRALRDPQGFAESWSPPGREMVLDQMPPPHAEELGTRSRMFRPRVLSWFWPFGREEPHGHPPFYAIVGVVGDVLVPWWAELPRSRFGTMLAFSLAAGAIFAFMMRRYGPWAAAAAAGAWMLQPRFFAHGHYAAYDALLTSLWVGAILAFFRAVEFPAGSPPPRSPRWGWVITFGVLAGWLADTKFTGWFLPLPLLVWAGIYRDRRALLTFAVGGVVGLLTLYAFNPPWWSDPLGGVDLFLGSNLTREFTIPIKIEFLGKVYNTPIVSLPWYNTLVWTLLVTPPGLLALSLVGVGRALARAKSDRFGLLVLGNWAFLLLLRALPHTPGHDGERLFLPAFGFLALAAGLGAAWLTERLGRLGQGVTVLTLALAAADLALSLPAPLTYYSPAIGGLPGAVRLGMEPTYYWDGLDAETLDWLNANTPEGSKIKFATEPTSWMYLQRTGRLRRGVYAWEPGTYAWYVVQNRPGTLGPLEHDLIRRSKPARVVSKSGVPLVWVFPYSDVPAWRARMRSGLGESP